MNRRIRKKREKQQLARALNMLAEATTTELTNAQNPQGLEENRVVAKQGGAERRTP